MTVPGVLGHKADGQAVLLVCARVEVLHEDVASLHETQQARVQLLEFFRAERTVVLSPPDVALAGRFADDELVIRGPGGVLARKRDERPPDDGRALAAKHGFFI